MPPRGDGSLALRALARLHAGADRLDGRRVFHHPSGPERIRLGVRAVVEAQPPGVVEFLDERSGSGLGVEVLDVARTRGDAPVYTQ
jgi:hypothetical protein